MKKILNVKILLIFLAILLTFSPLCMAADSQVLLTSTSSEETIGESSIPTPNKTVIEKEVIESDVYEFNYEPILIENTVDGNIFAFGTDVTIDCEVGGDVLIFGNEILITEASIIHGNVFVCGNNVTMNGVCPDLYAAANSLSLGVTSLISRDLHATATDMTINGRVGRDAYIAANNVVFAENTANIISGDLHYSSNEKLNIDDMVVGGTIHFDEISEEDTVSPFVSFINDLLASLLYSLAIVLLIVWLAPNFSKRASILLKKKSPAAFGFGLLTCVAIVAGSLILLIITGGLGFSISLAAIAFFILALTISKTVFCVACAKLINEKLQKDNTLMLVIMTIVANLVISLITLIPFVGEIIGFIVSMIGLGILVLNLVSKQNLED